MRLPRRRNNRRAGLYGLWRLVSRLPSTLVRCISHTLNREGPAPTHIDLDQARGYAKSELGAGNGADASIRSKRDARLMADIRRTDWQSHAQTGVSLLPLAMIAAVVVVVVRRSNVIRQHS